MVFPSVYLSVVCSLWGSIVLLYHGSCLVIDIVFAFGLVRPSVLLWVANSPCLQHRTTVPTYLDTYVVPCWAQCRLVDASHDIDNTWIGTIDIGRRWCGRRKMRFCRTWMDPAESGLVRSWGWMCVVAGGFRREIVVVVGLWFGDPELGVVTCA